MTSRISNGNQRQYHSIDSEFIVFVTFSVWIMGIYTSRNLRTHNIHQPFNFFLNT